MGKIARCLSSCFGPWGQMGTVGLGPRMLGVALCSGRGLLQFQGVHMQGCLGSYPFLMGDFHPLLISHTKKHRALEFGFINEAHFFTVTFHHLCPREWSAASHP